MNNLQKLRARSFLKWVSSRFFENQSQSLNFPSFPTGSQNPRFYRTKRSPDDEGPIPGKFSPTVLRKAEAAFTDYLHSTRSLQFAAAESIGKNSPRFLSELLEKIDLNDNIEQSLARYLRYHPINEFEPFFESIGLKQAEYASLLPRDMMFLSDCDGLLTNYLLLCNYGVEPCKIGRIYKDVRAVFEQEPAALALLAKVRAYENLGIGQGLMVKAILCSPCILIGDVNTEFVEVLKRFGILGFKQRWIEAQLCEGGGYQWSQILELLCLFTRMGFTNEQLHGLIRQNPGILFEDSGAQTCSLIGLLVKFGTKGDEIQNVFLECPTIAVGKFLADLGQSFIFLTEIDMEAEEIDKIIRSEALLLGSSTLKKANSMLTNLNVGKKRICDIIKENPKEMGNWVMGMKVGQAPRLHPDEISLLEKRKFLSSLGITKGSKSMERAIKAFRGKGQELQERFDCIVESGLDEKGVREMIRVSPQILNQSKDLLEMKLDFLVHEFNYPLSSLKRFPSYLSFKIERIKVRHLMFTWLSERGAVQPPPLALSTIVACSFGAFEKQYVQLHPVGLEVWRNLKKRCVRLDQILRFSPPIDIHEGALPNLFRLHPEVGC